MINVLIALTIGIPWVGALVVWLVGDKNERLQHWLAVVFSAAAGVASLFMLPYTSGRTAAILQMGGVFGDFTFVADGLGIYLSIIATVIGCLAVVFSTSYMKGEASLGRYYAYVLFFIGGMAGLVLTSNLLLTFLFWEITALCSYALIAFHNDDPKAVRGGVKALIITSVGGVGLLLGALIVHTYTGNYDINSFLSNPSVLPVNVLAVLAFGFLIAAAAKSAQFPFQTWLPDAMEAPSPISALIHAATMVNAGVYLLARFFPAFESVPFWREAVMIVGTLSAILAAIMALTASDLKRVLAYSTVSQLGYMVYAIGAGGVLASQFHLFSHSIFKALLFLAAGAVIHSIGTRDMNEMGGVGRKLPFVKWVFIIGGLALAGIPIFNGFWSKEMILESGLTGGPLWLYVVMVLVAGLTALYTIRCVWLVFFGEPRSDYHAHPAGLAMKVPLGLLAIGALTSWLLVDGFSRLFGENSLPYHKIHTINLEELFREILTVPTYVTLGVIAAGILLWLIRNRLNGFVNGLKSLSWASERSFGFEAINSAVVGVTNSIAEKMRSTQTGILSWNVIGIIAAVVILFAIVVVGG